MNSYDYMYVHVLGRHYYIKLYACVHIFVLCYCLGMLMFLWNLFIDKTFIVHWTFYFMMSTCFCLSPQTNLSGLFKWYIMLKIKKWNMQSFVIVLLLAGLTDKHALINREFTDKQNMLQTKLRQLIFFLIWFFFKTFLQRVLLVLIYLQLKTQRGKNKLNDLYDQLLIFILLIHCLICLV